MKVLYNNVYRNTILHIIVVKLIIHKVLAAAEKSVTGESTIDSIAL